LPILLLILLPTHAAHAAGPAAAKDGFLKTSDGVRLRYLEAGSGPAILFEPGWSMPAWIWDPQIRHHVIALDPRS
jgi:non-heme chloroperoxidase